MTGRFWDTQVDPTARLEVGAALARLQDPVELLAQEREARRRAEAELHAVQVRCHGLARAVRSAHIVPSNTDAGGFGAEVCKLCWVCRVCLLGLWGGGGIRRLRWWRGSRPSAGSRRCRRS
jgi:hypothetical protein